MNPFAKRHQDNIHSLRRGGTDAPKQHVQTCEVDIGMVHGDDGLRFGRQHVEHIDVMVVIGLLVPPEGFPLACEVLPGNTSDKVTLAGFLQRIEAQYGKAHRVWVMDRGIPTETTLATRRNAITPVPYLVGTPKVISWTTWATDSNMHPRGVN